MPAEDRNGDRGDFGPGVHALAGMAPQRIRVQARSWCSLMAVVAVDVESRLSAGALNGGGIGFWRSIDPEDRTWN